MRRRLHQWMQALWYRNPKPWWMHCITWLLLPFSLLYYFALKGRELAYRWHLLKQHRLPVPVIIVGNLTVGGTGKTPTVIKIAQYLKQQGYHPGILTRGYGRLIEVKKPMIVTPGDDAQDPTKAGEEAILIAEKSNCPVAVATDRAAAGQLLIEQQNCNIIVSDDGLQHTALARDIEVVVIDGYRRFGNGWLLPAGPCRELKSRLNKVDIIVTKDKPLDGEFVLHYQHDHAYAINNPALTKPLSAFQRELSMPLMAIAGIGHPQHFFTMLTLKGIQFTPVAYPDHYQYRASEAIFNSNNLILTTEKDAVKIKSFANDQHWCVALSVTLPETFFASFAQQLQKVTNRV